MFRTSFRAFLKRNAQQKAKLLCDTLAAQDLCYTVNWQQVHPRGNEKIVAARKDTARQSRSKQHEVISVDLCRRHDSQRHFRVLLKRLSPLLEACEQSGLCHDEDVISLCLDMTASNGSDDTAFIRRCYFSEPLIKLCAQHNIAIRIDVVPLDDDAA